MSGPEGTLSRGDTTEGKGLLNTRRDRTIFGVFVAILVLHIPFALAGYDLARYVALEGFGGAVAFMTADSIAHLFGNKNRIGLFLLAVGLAGLPALLFSLPYEWMFVEHAPKYTEGVLTQHTDHTAFFLFTRGFLDGLTAGAIALLSRSPVTRREVREQRRAAMRGLLIVGGGVAALFGLLFAAYVAFYYVLGPLVRFFAQ